MKSIIECLNESASEAMKIVTKYLDAYDVISNGVDGTKHKYAVVCHKRSDIEDICGNICKACDDSSSSIGSMVKLYQKMWDNDLVEEKSRVIYIPFEIYE